MTGAMNHLFQGSGWNRRRQRFGAVGSVRAVEVTHGENGWHPHVHAALLFESEPTDLEEWLAERWAHIVSREGFGTINHHGVDVQPIIASGTGNYLAKIDGGWGAGLELARGDIKRSAPVELLRDYVQTGSRRSAALWQEYEEATRGKRAIRLSPGLRARFLGTDEGLSDVEAAEAEGLDLPYCEVDYDADDWRWLTLSGEVAQELNKVEQLTALWLLMSINPQPLEVRCVEEEAL